MKTRYDMVTVFVARPDASGAPHEFLQLLRSPGQYMCGTWQTISGGIEPAETAVAAALREMREESGLTPIEFYRLPSIESFYTVADDTIWHPAAFFALVSRDVKVALDHEHTDHRWASIDRVNETFMWPGERALIREIRDEILGNGLAKPHLLIKL
ncbi:MAG: NUDIX domain-containing protein [Tepidisphaeraceae bacterium]